MADDHDQTRQKNEHNDDKIMADNKILRKIS